MTMILPLLSDGPSGRDNRWDDDEADQPRTVVYVDHYLVPILSLLTTDGWTGVDELLKLAKTKRLDKSYYARARVANRAFSGWKAALRTYPHFIERDLLELRRQCLVEEQDNRWRRVIPLHVVGGSSDQTRAINYGERKALKTLTPRFRGRILVLSDGLWGFELAADLVLLKMLDDEWAPLDLVAVI